MEILVKKYSNFNFIELIVRDRNAELTVSVTNLKGIVDESLIHNLRQVADELEEHNKQTREKA